MSNCNACICVLIALLLTCDISSSFRILLMPILGGSHLRLFIIIGEELAKRGHEVVILVPGDLKIPIELTSNTSAMKVEKYGEGMREELGYLDPDSFHANMFNNMLEQHWDIGVFLKAWSPVIESEKSRLLKDNDALLERLNSSKFDMAVVDQLFFKTYGYLIPHSLGVPWVTYTDSIEAWNARVPHLPSFVPHKMLSAYSSKMTFKERFVNTFLNIAAPLFTGIGDPPETLIHKYRQYGEFSSMDDLQKRSVLFITGNDIVLDYQVPVMPNTINAGGLTVKPSSGKALPKDIDHFMNGATNGVVLVTFGSMVSKLPVEVVRKFVTVFKNLTGCRIIWRLDNKDNIAIPENVLISKWLPQNDLLADPRVNLFITHSGSNGQFEAVYHAVPMIGMPIMGDQPYNAKRMEHKGYGIAMNLNVFTESELMDNIKRILTDRSYKDRITLASNIFKSARDAPAERIAYWIEHVTQFGGGHLRSDGNDLAMYEYLMLDILLVVMVFFVTVLTCTYKIIQIVYRRYVKVDIRQKGIKSD